MSTQPAITCLKLPMETLEKGEKYVQNRNMLAIKTPERRQADDFIVNFEPISHLVLMFLLLTLSR